MNLEKILTGQTTEHLIDVDDYTINAGIQSDFCALKGAAIKAGFAVEIASSFRDFNRQLGIWNRKFNGEQPLLDSKSQPLDTHNLSDDQKIVAILRWSALPGASRHHWGTDLDIFAANLLPKQATLQLEPWEYLTGHQAPFYAWLTAHVQQFGFFFPYAKDKGGIAVEPWHISHVSCAGFYQSQLSLALLKKTIDNSDIVGKKRIISMLPDLYPRFITNISSPCALPFHPVS